MHRRRAVLIGVVATLLTLSPAVAQAQETPTSQPNPVRQTALTVLAPPPAATPPPTPGPPLRPSSVSGPATTDSCRPSDTLLKKARTLGQRFVVCHTSGRRPDAESKAALRRTMAAIRTGKETAAPAAQLTPQPLPSWCAEPEHMDGQWWFMRRDACLVDIAKMNIFDTRGTWLGSMEYHDVRYVYNRGGIDSVYQLSITPWKFEGTGFAGMNLRFTPSCGNCTTVATSTVHPVVKDVIITKEMGVRSTLVNRGDRGDATGSLSLDFSVPGEVADIEAEATALPLRCDHALPGNNTTPGCVFEGFDPWLSLHYNDPEIGWNALNVGWAIYTGLPSHLQRLHDPSQSKANGDRACPSGASYPRPTDYECDEYPFRSTQQGASTSGTPFAPRTFPPGNCPLTDTWPNTPVVTTYIGSDGWARCNIPRSHNQKGGERLATFYRDERVLPGDWFHVSAAN